MGSGFPGGLWHPVVLLLLRGFLGFGVAIWVGGHAGGDPVSGILGGYLRSVAGYLGLAFVVGGALRGGVRGYCYFRDFFAKFVVLARFSFWWGEWALGHHFLGFRHFLSIY